MPPSDVCKKRYIQRIRNAIHHTPWADTDLIRLIDSKSFLLDFARMQNHVEMVIYIAFIYKYSARQSFFIFSIV